MKFPVISRFRSAARVHLDAVRRTSLATAARPAAPAPRPRRWARLTTVLGWAGRISVGAFLCYNVCLISFLTSVVVAGWTNRWMQGIVLRSWWKRSRFHGQGSFNDFCGSLGPDAPALHPRWFRQERSNSVRARWPAPAGRSGVLYLVWRALQLPCRSLWLNFKIGAQALFFTNLLVAWGCLLMVISWEFGWLNSFNKGYEERLIGPVTGYGGIVLFCIAMIYVPMAQAYQAATGDYRVFFECRVLARLIHARMTAYVGLAALVTVASFPLEVLKALPVLFDKGCPILVQDLLERQEFTRSLPDYLGNLFPGFSGFSQAKVRASLQIYLMASSVVLFVLLLLVRLVAAQVFRSAVLKALRRGWISRNELHPRLVGWLDRLDLVPQPVPSPTGVWRALRLIARWSYRVAVYLVLFGLWFAFCAQVYVGEFLNYHPGLGFLNHPLIQFPCFDYFPTHLLNLPARQG